MPSAASTCMTQWIRRRPENDIAAFDRRYPGAFSVSGRARTPCPPARPMPTTSVASGMSGVYRGAHDGRSTSRGYLATAGYDAGADEEGAADGAVGQGVRGADRRAGVREPGARRP